MSQKFSQKIILASLSPRRLDLLQSLGLSFDVVPSHVDENLDNGSQPAEVAVGLALSKARQVADLFLAGQARPTAVVGEGGTTSGGKAEPDSRTLVLGADTIVVVDGDMLGKPETAEEACAMLARLSGRGHQVITGVAVIELPGNRVETSYEVSNVYFRRMDPIEIRQYVAGGEPMDKAGAYALQGTGSAFVERIDGCFTNVIGLPIPQVVEILRRLGVSVLGMP